MKFLKSIIYINTLYSMAHHIFHLARGHMVRIRFSTTVLVCQNVSDNFQIQTKQTDVLPNVKGLTLSLLTSCVQPPKHSRHWYPGGQCECQSLNELVPWQTIGMVDAVLLQHTWTGHHGNIPALHNPEEVSCGAHAANTFPFIVKTFFKITCTVLQML